MEGDGVVTKVRNIGIHDLPIFDDSYDLFEVKPYIEALSDFIRESATPITIALQGGWGTGKTSFINLINKQLNPIKRLGEPDIAKTYDKSPIITVNFNTWQYTQFNLEQNLGISFLSYIINKLTEELPEENKFVAEAAKAIKGIARFGLNVILAQGGMQQTNSDDAKKDSVLDPAQAIEMLRNSLEDVVKKLMEKYGTPNNPARLVIFIDDLDRLKPSIAVSLLEVIKLFLDIEGCIFVLAVDNRVIEEGITEAKQTSRVKTKSFLDKMIQVPFKIPVEIYNYRKFLNDNLGILSENEELSNELQSLIQFSVGSNPRAMKRLINNFYLNNKVNMIIDKQTNPSSYEQCILIAIICMQLACQPLYITMRNSDSKLELLNKTTSEEGLFIDLLRDEFIELESLNLFEEDIKHGIETYDRFLDYLKTVILLTVNKKGTELLMEEDLTVFNKILKRSDMTSGSQSQTKSEENLGNIVNVKLLDFINNMKKYRLEKKQTLIYGEVGEREKIYNMKEGFQVIVNKAVTTREHIEKLKNIDGLKNHNIARIVYFRLLPESEWSEAEKTYKTLEFGNQDLGTVILGHSFANAESARQLYRLLTYLDSDIVENVYLQARPVL
ncbi:P-loop NTPase fold protein [Lysinibacillus sp. AR18-8]|uniref:KAP family P-loop NTPase fold protein n=1 Tax=Lysinibacillus sp. AR18-8 TaxID=1889781 RepID=UPI0009F47970|nr:P-loop NTPase fold protein [Lysinibacillus sp. AR18-8]